MARATVWNSKNVVTPYLSGDGLTSTLDLDAKAATKLAADLLKAVDSLPRVAEAADIGLEVA